MRYYRRPVRSAKSNEQSPISSVEPADLLAALLHQLELNMPPDSFRFKTQKGLDDGLLIYMDNPFDVFFDSFDDDVEFTLSHRNDLTSESFLYDGSTSFTRFVEDAAQDVALYLEQNYGPVDSSRPQRCPTCGRRF